MSTGFDAYHKWLSIPPHDQPPNHYRLLGLGLFETDGDVIAAAADRQMAHVQTYKTGPHSELSQRLLNEISAAKLCLLRPHKRAAYDDQLRQQLAASGGAANGAMPPAPTPPFGVPVGASAGVPAAAPRLNNPAPFANASGSAPLGSSAAATAVAPRDSRGMPYPGYPGGPVPPPPTLPPPIADSPKPLMSTAAILAAAGGVGALLLVGIALVLGNRGSHSPSGADKAATIPSTGANANGQSPGQATGANPSAHVQPSSAQVAGTTAPPTTQPGPPSTPPPPPNFSRPSAFQGTGVNVTPPKVTQPATTGDAGTKPPLASKPPANGSATKPANEVATTIPSGVGPPDKGNPAGKTPATPPNSPPNPFATPPSKPAPSNPATDPLLAGKIPLPPKAAITAVEQRLDQAGTLQPADLIDQAHKATEAAELYVLLRRALDGAVKQGDAAMAISTADELVRRFAVDSLGLQSQMIDQLQGHDLTPESSAAVANAAAALIEEASAAGRADLAEHMAELSLISARKSADIDTIRKITLQIVRMRAGAPPAAPVTPGS